MEWLNITATTGLWGLLLASFLAATVLPGGSEVFFWGFIALHPQEHIAALLIATLGNTAGGMVSWWCGRSLPENTLISSRLRAIQRWGSPLLLLSWLPVVGDGLCLAAGWLRLRWWPCCTFMAIGKLARYAALAWVLGPSMLQP